MGTGITQTLREKLFDHPAPLGREREFASLVTEMFPGRSHFLAFLDERRFEEQVEMAKHILLRLAYQSRLSPPNKFLYNLLDTESRLAGSTAKGPFNGRDHFVHLVSLYLLGLYLFWYHGPFHAKLCKQFNRLAATKSGSRREKHISSCRAFLGAWREFVLFHDLGYPWEVAQGTEDTASLLAPFGQVDSFTSKDNALFIISQLLALEWLRREEPALFEEEFRDSFGNFDKPIPLQEDMFAPRRQMDLEQVVRDWAKAERLPPTSDAGLWRLIQVIVPAQDRLSVLETAGEGHPVGLRADNYSLIANLSQPSRDEISNVVDSSTWADSNTLPTSLRGHYHWVHFVRGYETHFQQFTADLFSRNQKNPLNQEDLDQFPRFLQEFLDSFPPTQAVSEELQFEDHAYAMFHRLLESLDFDTFDGDDVGPLIIHHSIARSEMKGLQGRLLNEVGAKLLELLRQRAEDLEGQGRSINNTRLAEYLVDLLAPLNETRNRAAAIEQRLSKQVKERVTLKQFLHTYYHKLKQVITLRIPKPSPIFPYAKKKTSESTAEKRKATAKTKEHGAGNSTSSITGPDWAAFENSIRSTKIALVDRILADRELGGITTLGQYTPRWAPKSKGSPVVFADHGLASGLLYAQVFAVHENLLSEKDSPVGKLLNLRGMTEEMGAKAHQGAASTSLNASVCEVLYTVFIHNLYPEFFDPERRTFRTKLEREPFAYFALLCDSLQPWDRKRLFNQASGSLSYNTYAENFNIEIEGKILRITERGDQLRIDDRQAALRGYLNSFLEGASDFVRLHLSEWRF